MINSTEAAYYQWTGAASSDLNTAGNWKVWDGTAWQVPTTAPGGGDRADFVVDNSPNPNPTIDSGTFSVLYLQMADELASSWPDGSGSPARTFSGAGTITISSNGNIDTWVASGPITFNVGDLRLTRAASLYAGSSGGSTGQDLIINSSAFHVGVGGSSGTPAFNAVGANIAITPTVDFSDASTNRSLNLRPSTGRTITLTNGVAPTTRLARINIDGGVGGTVYMGDSTTWAGYILIYNSDIEVNHNTSLGDAGTIAGSYTGMTEFYPTATNVGALVLTNNITTNEAMFLSTRNSTVAQIKNKSGHNILSGTLGIESSDGGSFVALQSDGTGVGDLLDISGTIQPTSYATGANTIVLQGAGEGLVSGTISATTLVSGTGTGDGGTLDVTKDGAGLWTLTGTNTYTGPTTIANGTLSLGATGSIANSSAITVKSGAFFKVSDLPGGGYALPFSQTLGGGGTVTGNVTVGGGTTIAPGESTGTLKIAGNLNLDSSSLTYDLPNDPAGVNDRIDVAGSLNVSGLNMLTLNAPGGYLANGSYRLINYTGAAVAPSNFLYTGITAFGRQSFNVTSVANQVNLNVTGAANLTWVGGNNSDAWDVMSTVNWTGASDNRFFDGDMVTFANTGTKTPYVPAYVNPGKVNFTNSVGHDYTVSGPGSITVLNNLNASGSGNVTFYSDVTVNGTFNATGSGDVIFANANLYVNGGFSMNGTGKVTLANLGGISLPSTVALNSGTLVWNRWDEAISSGFTGTGTFRKEGSDTTLTLSGDNSAFEGTMVVAQGTLKTEGPNALAATTVLDGATLDIWNNNLGNVPLQGTEVVTITGSGVNGFGALITTQGFQDSSAQLKTLILAGDSKIAAIGASSGRSILWVGGTDGTLQGNGHNLDVVVNNNGSNGTEIDWINVGNTNLNNINISGGGALYVGGDTTLGPTTGKVTLLEHGILGIYGSLAGESASTGLIDKPILVENTSSGGAIELYVGSKTVESPITMDGAFQLTTYSNAGVSTLTLTEKLTGAGNLALHHAGNSTTSRRGMVEFTSNDNDFTGTITVGGGGGFAAADPTRDRISLSIGNGGNTGTLGPGEVIVNGLGTTTDRVILKLNRGGVYTVSNKLTINNAQIRSFHTGGDVTLAGDISGSCILFNDAGTMTLSGTNTFEGNYECGGEYGPSMLKIAKQVSLFNNDTAQWITAASSDPEVINHIYVGSGNTMAFNVGGAGEFTASDMNILASLGTEGWGFTSGAGIGFDTTNSPGGNFTYATPLANPNGGANVRNLVKLGNNSLTLTAALTYTGTTTIEAGTLAIENGVANTLTMISGPGTLTVGATASATSLTATSIVVDTLTIGTAGGAAAVPEPSSWLLLVVGSGWFAMFLRKKAK